MAIDTLTAGEHRSQRLIRCAECRIEVPKRNSRHLYCDPCRHEVTKRSKRACEERKRRAAGSAKVGGVFRCRICAVTVVRSSGFQKFCRSCEPIKVKSDKRKATIREMARDPEQARARQRRYYERNKERVLARHREAGRNPDRKLHRHMTAMVGFALRGAKAWRSWRTMVDYSVDDLRRHLERQFQKGMSWENMGEWHIDHIVPRREFKFERPEDPDFRACWALTNLRPLWRSENCAKGGRRLHLL